LAHSLAERARECHALVHGGGAERHERTYIGRPHARVLAVVLRHVDELGGLRDAAKRRFYHMF